MKTATVSEYNLMDTKLKNTKERDAALKCYQANPRISPAVNGTILSLYFGAAAIPGSSGVRRALFGNSCSPPPSSGLFAPEFGSS